MTFEILSALDSDDCNWGPGLPEFSHWLKFSGGSHCVTRLAGE